MGHNFVCQCRECSEKWRRRRELIRERIEERGGGLSKAELRKENKRFRSRMEFGKHSVWQGSR